MALNAPKFLYFFLSYFLPIMKLKDWGSKFVFAGAIIFVSGILLTILTLIFPILLNLSVISPVLLVLGLVFVVIGGLSGEKKARLETSNNSLEKAKTE